MVCRIADAIEEPTITEHTHETVSVWNERKRGWDRHEEVYLVPYYTVSVVYDFGFCCGVDSSEFRFATREAAEDFCTELKAGNHPWIRYDQESIDERNSE